MDPPPRRLCARSLLCGTSVDTATSHPWLDSTTWPIGTSRLRKRADPDAERAATRRNHLIGGGSPTRLDAALLSRLLTIVRSWFPLAAGGEWTVEANPGTLDAEKVEVLVAQGGVNRVSLGAKSFEPRLLENSSGTMLRTTSTGRSNSCSLATPGRARWTSSSGLAPQPLRIAIVT